MAASSEDSSPALDEGLAIDIGAIDIGAIDIGASSAGAGGAGPDDGGGGPGHGRRRPPMGGAFWRLWAAIGISASGDGLLLVALPLLALDSTHRLALIAGVTAINGLARALCNVPAGVMVDRFDRRKLMVVCNLVSACALGAMVLDMTLGPVRLYVIYLVALVLPMSDGCWDLAMNAYVPEVSRPETFSEVMGRVQGIDIAGEQVLGPAIGGILFGFARRAPFISDAISFVFSAGLYFTLPSQRPLVSAWPAPVAEDAPSRAPAAKRGRPRHARPGWAEDFAEGARIFRQLKTLHLVGLSVAWLSLSCYMVISLIVVYARDDLHLSATGYGLFVACAAALGVAGSFAAGPLERRFGSVAVISGGCFLAGLSYLSLAVTHSVVAAVFAFGLQEIGVAVGNVGFAAARQRMVPRHLFGRVIGIYRVAIALSIPLGAALASFVAGHWGISTNMAVAGVLVWLAVPILMPTLRRRLNEAPA